MGSISVALDVPLPQAHSPPTTALSQTKFNALADWRKGRKTGTGGNRGNREEFFLFSVLSVAFCWFLRSRFLKLLIREGKERWAIAIGGSQLSLWPFSSFSS